MVGQQVWRKNQGRTIDPSKAHGHARPAAFKLYCYTEKSELDYFMAVFPSHLIAEIAVGMTDRGGLLGFGSTWEVSVGEAWRFIGYNMAIMVLHTWGPKEDLWLDNDNKKYDGALFS